jgi:hypothetical protein
LLGNDRNTHAVNNKGAVLSVVRAATVAMQLAIHAANSTERLCFLLWSMPSGYKGHGSSFESFELEAPACQDMRLGAKEQN